MIPVSLKLSNFTSYGENVPLLDFRKIHLAAISGQNGAGKSSLLDAITWCIWGTSRLGDSSDQLVRLGQKQMWVEFSFALDNHIYTVLRKRVLKGAGSTSLDFTSGSPAKGGAQHNLTEGTIKSTQQKIIDTLHLTYETFTNSAFLRQGHADEFTTKGPMDRKRILADILGLSSYDLLEEKAKEKVRDVQSNLQRLEYQILEIEAELSQKEERDEKKKIAEEEIARIETDIKNLEEKLKILQGQREALKIAGQQREKLEQNFLQNKKELEEIISQGKKRKENIDSLKIQLNKLKDVTAELSKLKDLQIEKEKMNQVKNKRLKIEKNLSESLGQINLKKHKILQLKNEIEKLNLQIKDSGKAGAKCPTCGQEIGKAEKAHVHKQLSAQIEVLQKELSKIDFTDEERKFQNLQASLKSLTFDQGKYQVLCSKLDGLEKAQLQKEQMLKIQATLSSEEKIVLEMRVLFQNKNQQVNEQKKELEKYPDQLDKLAQLDQSISETERQLNDRRQAEKQAQNSLGEINTLISRTSQMEKLQTQKMEEKIILQKDKENFEELALAFGKKGIQAMIIETAIPEIEDETNRLLDKLSDGRMKIRFETQRETKGKIAGTGEKGLVETLDIIISDETGDRPYEGYSGGEQFRVNFAIRLALSKLLTHRAGARLQFLVIDEGFGTQDAQGRSRIVEALNAIKDDFAKILVITHLEELKEEFPVRIEVSKNSSGSTFQVVGI